MDDFRALTVAEQTLKKDAHEQKYDENVWTNNFNGDGKTREI